MLPFLCLAILCGLLAQKAHGNGHPLAIASLGPEMLQQLILHQMNPQDLTNRLRSLPLEDMVKKGIQEGNGGGGFLSGFPILGGFLNNVVGNIVGLKIKNVELLKVSIKFDEKEARLFVVIPADIELEVKTLLGRLLHLKLYLDVQVGVRLHKDPYTGHTRLAIGNCENTPGHLRITVLDNSNILMQAVNNVLRLVTNVLEKTLPHLLQKELCPLVNGILQIVLDLLQAPFHSQMHGGNLQFLPQSFDLHDGSFNLAYQGMMQQPGGQSTMIPPGSAPLSTVPLGGSSMNMVLSGSYLSSAVRALLSPQSFTFNMAGQGEGTGLRQRLAAVLPEASNIRTLQIASGAPSLSLEVGKIEMWQPIEIKMYNEHSAEAHRPILILRANSVSDVHPSAAGGKMVLTLHRPRSQNIQMTIRRAVDLQNLSNIISHLISVSILPQQNKMLAEGIPLPLVHNLGVDSLQVTVGKDAVIVFAPSHVTP